jgi:hypothetical protein
VPGSSHVIRHLKEGSHNGNHPQQHRHGQGARRLVHRRRLHRRRGRRSRPARVQADLVHFSPGARTAWHMHPLGQTIYVTEGIGRCQRAAARLGSSAPAIASSSNRARTTGMAPTQTASWPNVVQRWTRPRVPVNAGVIEVRRSNVVWLGAPSSGSSAGGSYGTLGGGSGNCAERRSGGQPRTICPLRRAVCRLAFVPNRLRRGYEQD